MIGTYGDLAKLGARHGQWICSGRMTSWRGMIPRYCGRSADMVTKEKAMYTTREAAAVVCCHIKTLRDYIVDGKLRAIRRGGGNYLIHENDLRAFLELEPDETLTCSVEDEP